MDYCLDKPPISKKVEFNIPSVETPGTVKWTKNKSLFTLVSLDCPFDRDDTPDFASNMEKYVSESKFKPTVALNPKSPLKSYEKLTFSQIDDDMLDVSIDNPTKESSSGYR